MHGQPHKPRRRVGARLLPALVLCAGGALTACPAAGGGLQRCLVDGEVLFTDTACPDQTRGEAVTVETPDLGNYDDALRVQEQADGLWLYKRGDDAPASGKAAAKGRSADAPVARPQRVELLNAIRRRQVLDGMTPEEVQRAWGPPTTTTRGSDGGQSWTYRGIDSAGNRQQRRIRFTDGHVDGWSTTEARARSRFDPDQGRWLD